MRPVISFWSKSQAPVDLIFYLPGSPQLHIYSLNLVINHVCQWMVFSLYHKADNWLW